jgi:DNA-binding CsgD family transcriptional regulator
MSITPLNGLSAALAGACAISFIYAGLYILFTARKDIILRPLLYLCFISSAWSFCYVMYFISSDFAIRELWQRMCFAGMSTMVFFLWFFMNYTGLIENRRITSFLTVAIWVPPLIILYENFAENAILHDFPSGFWFLYAEIQPFSYCFISIVFIYIYCTKSKTNKGRRGAYILCVSAIILLLSSTIADYFFGVQGSLNIIPFWVLLWIGILLFTIKKYRFIVLSPDIISSDITENIEEGTILLDPELNAIFTNRAARRLFNVDETEPIRLQDFVIEGHILDGELAKLIHTESVSFRARLNLSPRETRQKLTVDMKVKKVIDKYNDLSGFLIIVSRTKNIEHLKTIYKLTGREVEVINQLAVGKTNKEIADYFKITEKTIETHIANIYGKLLVRNRIELINIVSEFNPAGPSLAGHGFSPK